MALSQWRCCGVARRASIVQLQDFGPGRTSHHWSGGQSLGALTPNGASKSARVRQPILNSPRTITCKKKNTNFWYRGPPHKRNEPPSRGSYCACVVIRLRACTHAKLMPATDLHNAAKVGEMDEAEKFLAIEENKARWVAFATAACFSWCFGAWHSRLASDSSNNISERRINETDSTGWTALHWAASRSRVSGALCPDVHAGLCCCWSCTQPD